MTTVANVKSYYELVENDERYELIYVTLTLFVRTLKALISSFLGLRRRRRHDPPSWSSIHGAAGRSDRLRVKTKFVFKLIDNAHVMIEPPP